MGFLWFLPSLSVLRLLRLLRPGRVVMRQGLLRLRALELDLARDEARAAVGIAHPLHVAGAKERNT